MLKSTMIKASKLALTTAGTMLFAFTAFAQSTGFLSPSDNPSRVSAATQGESSARALVLIILNYFLGFLGLVAVIMVIYGGILMVTAGQKADQVGQGKKILMYAAAGIIVILLSFAIVNTILGAGSGADA